jgi:hypothetical protein
VCGGFGREVRRSRESTGETRQRERLLTRRGNEEPPCAGLAERAAVLRDGAEVQEKRPAGDGSAMPYSMSFLAQAAFVI